MKYCIMYHIYETVREVYIKIINKTVRQLKKIYFLKVLFYS